MNGCLAFTSFLVTRLAPARSVCTKLDPDQVFLGQELDHVVVVEFLAVQRETPSHRTLRDQDNRPRLDQRKLLLLLEPVLPCGVPNRTHCGGMKRDLVQIALGSSVLDQRPASDVGC